MYFENVGGAVFAAVLPLLNTKARIPMQRFIVFDDYAPRWSEFAGAMRAWAQDDKVKVRDDIGFGLENAPEAFIGLLQGKHFGKLLMQLAQE